MLAWPASPHLRLLLALALGIVLGAALSPYADGTWIGWVNGAVLRPIGQLFLRLIFMIVVPMVVAALVVGVFDLGRGRDLSGVVGRTLAFTVVLSTAAVVIGISLVNLLQPGRGIALQDSLAAGRIFRDFGFVGHIVRLCPSRRRKERRFAGSGGGAAAR